MRYLGISNSDVSAVVIASVFYEIKPATVFVWRTVVQRIHLVGFCHSAVPMLLIFTM